MSDTTDSMPSAAYTILIFVAITCAVYTYRIVTHDTQPVVSLMGYFLIVIIAEFFLNNKIVKGNCGDTDWNLTAMATFIPWIVIMGTLLLFLQLFPSWKTPFSNTFGLFIANLAGLKKVVNNIFDFSDPRRFDIETAITKQQTETTGASNVHNKPLTGGSSDTENVANMNRVAALANIYKDNSLIINEFTLFNFDEQWENLRRSGLFPRGKDNNSNKNKIKGFILLKDLIGEFMWFLLTGIFVSTVSYNYIITSGCAKSAADMKQRHEAYEEELEQSNAVSTSYQTYSLE